MNQTKPGNAPPRKSQPFTLRKTPQVLPPQILSLFMKCDTLKERGFRILERWALNQPDELRLMTGKSPVYLLMCLLEQQKAEKMILGRPEVQAQLAGA